MNQTTKRKQIVNLIRNVKYAMCMGDLQLADAFMQQATDIEFSKVKHPTAHWRQTSEIPDVSKYQKLTKEIVKDLEGVANEIES